MKKKIFFVIFLTFFIILLKITTSQAAEIPKVYLEGNIEYMESKKDERDIVLKYTSSDIIFEKYAKIKVQGSSSLAYDKKNYTINFYEDDSYDKKSKVDVGKGWGAQSKYNLKANWTDKTHTRNVVSAKIAGKVQKKYHVLDELPNNGSIDGFPIEVYINNKFLGLYTWNIPKSAWMWNIDEDNPDHIVLEGAWYTEYVNFKKELDSFDETGWEVEVGKANEETLNNFNKLVKFINESTEEEFARDIGKYLDKDSTINYLLLVYMLQGVDNTGKNMILLTYNNGETWYPCLYDLDGTFGVLWDGKLSDSCTILPENPIADHDTNNLITKMIKSMPNEISARWFDLRKDIFSKEAILKEINDFTNSIPNETFEKEKERWDEIPGYDISQIEDFLNERLPYIDDLMKKRYTINIEEVNNTANIVLGLIKETAKLAMKYKII